MALFIGIYFKTYTINSSHLYKIAYIFKDKFPF